MKLDGEPGPEWRRCVGICLINADGMAWGAKRVGEKENVWQMPQGGIDEGEEPLAAARRELYEETGIKEELVELVMEHPNWLAYEFPADIKLKRKWLEKFRGQAQRWYLFRFKVRLRLVVRGLVRTCATHAPFPRRPQGSDSDVDISGLGGEPPEFAEWRWMSFAELESTVIDWKREVYTEAFGTFSEHSDVRA